MNELDDLLDKYKTASEAWNTYSAKKGLAKAEFEWIKNAKPWKSMVTLTFADEIYEDIAKKRFLRLVRVLNKKLFGNNYTRIVGHSYFSYVIGIENQKRGVIHFHFLVDKPVDFTYIHEYWKKSGFAWITKIINLEKSVYYVTKYVVKGGQIDHYFSKKDVIPRNIPFWWNVSDP